MRTKQRWMIAAGLMFAGVLQSTPAQKTAMTEDPAHPFRCPESFASESETASALRTFIQDYQARFPNQTVGAMMTYRYHLLVAHGCTKSLENMLTQVSPLTMMLWFQGGDYGPRTEEFDPDTGVSTEFFTEDGSPPHRPRKELIFNFYGWQPAIPPARIAQAWISRDDGTRTTIWKFQAPDELTKAPAFYIVTATFYPDERMGYVNVTKIAAITTSAYAVTFSQRIEGHTLAEIEKGAKAWLLSDEGKEATRTTGRMGAAPDWQEYLKDHHPAEPAHAEQKP